MPTEVTSSVEAIEIEAEKILNEARTGASKILLKAKEETREILSSKLPMDEVKTECDKVISKARVEGDRKIGDSEKKASEIGTNADKKIEAVVERIVSIVTGAKLT
mgnify:CR=1 FL=1